MQQGPFAAWQNFHMVIGEATATLVGLMFVAGSVGRGVFTEERATRVATDALEMRYSP